MPVIVDSRGRRCPLPVLDAARAVAAVAVGDTVTVEAEDPAAGPDLQAWCRMRGHEFLATGTATDGTPAHTLRRLH